MSHCASVIVASGSTSRASSIATHTIASRNEGFDGVNVDGENGFLCKAGDVQELASIINRINIMTSEERQRISDNAIETAKTLTDFKAAKRYIEDLQGV